MDTENQNPEIKMMREYIGLKRVVAWPEERNGVAGYGVEYQDGYKSWSPKDVFERAYMYMEFGVGVDFVTPDGLVATKPTAETVCAFDSATHGRGMLKRIGNTPNDVLNFILRWAVNGAPTMPMTDHYYTQRPLGVRSLQNMLPDNFSESKDWRDGDITERIEWLKSMMRSKSEECDMVWSWLAAYADDPEPGTVPLKSVISDRLLESGMVLSEIIEQLEDTKLNETMTKFITDAKIALQNSQIVYTTLNHLWQRMYMTREIANLDKCIAAAPLDSDELRNLQNRRAGCVKTLENISTLEKLNQGMHGITAIEGIDYAG